MVLNQMMGLSKNTIYVKNKEENLIFRNWNFSAMWNEHCSYKSLQKNG